MRDSLLVSYVQFLVFIRMFTRILQFFRAMKTLLGDVGDGQCNVQFLKV